MTPYRKRAAQIAAALLGVLTALGLVVVITDDPGPTPQAPHHRTVTVKLGGPGHAPVTLTPAAQAQLAANAKAAAPGGPAPALEHALHDTTAPTAAARARADHLTPPGQPKIPDQLPQAAANLPGCRTALVRNYSSRRGAPVLLGVIHWTGSWLDGNGIARWFDSAAAQASSNEYSDQQGRCWLMVPEAAKAWTQAAANPWSVSVEVQNPGVLPLLRTAAARAVVLRLMRGWHARWHIPYRHGVFSCSPYPHVVRSGFLAHRDLGACGGGHPDVGIPSVVDELIHQAAAGDPSSRPLTATDRVTCRKLQWWRSHRRPHGTAEARAVRRRRALDSRHVGCTARGPVRA